MVVFCCSSHEREQTPHHSETAGRDLWDTECEATQGSKLESEERVSHLLTKSTTQWVTSMSSWTLSGHLFN